MKNVFLIAGMVTIVTIAFLLSTSCDFFGSSSSGSSHTPSAADALKAVLLPSEAVLGSVDSAALRSAGLQALEASWPDFDQDAWDDACNEGDGSS